MPFFVKSMILLPVCLFVGAVVACVLYYIFSLLLGVINKKWLDVKYENAFFIIALFFVGTYYGICLSSIYTKDKLAKGAKTINEEKEKTEVVYICTSGTSKRYHSDRYCSGLGRCTGEIDEVSVGDAEDMGRTPCHICY